MLLLKTYVKYVKKNVHDPVFFFFTDPGSIEWCKQNQKKFGLNFSKDKVYFIDWNKGLESYRDMQLMTYCKHSIQSYSSFGWWGAYLMKNPNKCRYITLALNRNYDWFKLEYGNTITQPSEYNLAKSTISDM